MLRLDRAAIENILSQLDELGFLFKGYHLCREEDGLCLLGRGGYSSVYEMFDEGNPQKYYALKVIGFERHTVTTEEFYKTIMLQRALSERSEHILRILSVKELTIRLDEDGELEVIQSPESICLQFVLMEKLQGLLQKDKFRNVSVACELLCKEAEVLTLAGQIGQAILLMHQNKVLHRDIKLENIFWDGQEKQYKLGDFGIAKYTEGGNAETVVYTDGYGAPEVGYRQGEQYNATADIYSFGITLYLLLNDLHFPGANGYYVNMVQYSQEFVFPAARNASEELNRIIRKMCSYYKEDRYQSMAEVLAALNQMEEQRREKAASKNSVELTDFATETFREQKHSGSKEQKAKEQTEKEQTEKEQVNRIRWQKELKQREKKAYYAKWSVRYMFLLAQLIALLLWGGTG